MNEEYSATPILVLGFNRPELIDSRIRELNEMRAPIVRVSIDGGTNSKQDEIKAVITGAIQSFNGKSMPDILYRERNLGLSQHITLAITEVLQQYERVIVVEDDIVLSPNFYSNMLHAFATQENNHKIGLIGGFSSLHPPKTFAIRNAWRSTPYVSIWGWGVTREIWSEYQLDLKGIAIEESLRNSESWKSLSDWQRKVWLGRFSKISNGPLHTWDIQLQYLSFKLDLSNLLPLFRFVQNEGFNDERSAHTQGKRPRWMDNDKIDKRKIENPRISKLSSVFSKLLDSNTIAGDSKMIKIRSKVRKFI